LVGGTDSGKSTLSRILANYAVRAQRTPLLVDLDCGQNDLAPPGCVAACQLLHPASIDHESSMAFNASSLGHAPITYFYGHTSPMVNEELYRKTISSLAAAVFKKMDKHDAIRSSGCIINTCGLVEGAGYGLLLHAAQAFRVSAVLVIDNERLYNELKSDASLRDLTASFVKLPKSGGAVVRDKETRERARANKIREYFYGIGKELAPHQRQVRENDVHIVKFTGVNKAARSVHICKEIHFVWLCLICVFVICYQFFSVANRRQGPT
jgi:polyribonucleotide 5'-hydroxyl-kinase